MAVITPYYKEPLAQLRQCHDSVRAKASPAACAGGGWTRRRRINHWRRDYPSHEHRLTALDRVILRIGGVDAAFLDADNWYGPDHRQSPEGDDQHQADFISSGEPLLPGRK